MASAATMKRVKLNHLMYVRYQHRDILATSKFMLDFGFTVVSETAEKILYRGFGIDPVCLVSEQSSTGKERFLGGAWAVDDLEDLELAATIPGASPVTDCDEAIGGQMVSLNDPSGTPMYVHWGFHARSRAARDSETPETLKFNTWDNKRRLGEFQRLPDGPSHIHKLGHYGCEIRMANFEATLQWYLNRFTMAKTDSLFSPETGKDIMVFIHLDREEEYVDHHSFFLSAGDVHDDYEPHHASFEVDDFDSELKGHIYLEKKGWQLCWGVGRHILGSQIFDYWYDPEDFVLEHYADGDVVNCTHRPERVSATPDAISVWGPNVPLAFLTRKAEDRGKFVDTAPPVAPVTVV